MSEIRILPFRLLCQVCEFVGEELGGHPELGLVFFLSSPVALGNCDALSSGDSDSVDKRFGSNCLSRAPVLYLLKLRSSSCLEPRS